MNFAEKEDLVAKLQAEFNMSTKEKENSRTEYISSANALKINKALQITDEKVADKNEKHDSLEQILFKVREQHIRK